MGLSFFFFLEKVDIYSRNSKKLGGLAARVVSKGQMSLQLRLVGASANLQCVQIIAFL